MNTAKKIDLPQGFSQPDMNNLPSINGMDSNDIEALHKTFFNEIKTRKDVMNFEEWIKDQPNCVIGNPYPLFHKFADGMYSREIHFNKGELIVGAIHKKDYFVNVLQGRIWVVSEHGAKEIIAPAHFIAKAGVKHIGCTLEDTVWIDIHRVDSDNTEDAEKEILADSYKDLDNYNNVIKTEFSQMCEDLGYTEQEVRQISEIKEDLIDQPETDPVEVRDSGIEGKGVFVIHDINKDEPVGLARYGNFRTLVGRYTNHSDNPNTESVIHQNMIYFIAIKDINNGTEITVDYRDVREKALILNGGEQQCQQP